MVLKNEMRLLSIILSLISFAIVVSSCANTNNSNNISLSFNDLLSQMAETKSHSLEALELNLDTDLTLSDSSTDVQEIYTTKSQVLVNSTSCDLSITFYSGYFVGVHLTYYNLGDSFEQATQLVEIISSEQGDPIHYPIVDKQFGQLKSIDDIDLVIGYPVDYYEIWKLRDSDELKAMLIPEIDAEGLNLAIEYTLLPDETETISIFYEAVRESLSE